MATRPQFGPYSYRSSVKPFGEHGVLIAVPASLALWALLAAIAF